MTHELGSEYAGAATIQISGTPYRPIEAEVVLRGSFQPLDGRFHWYGRVAPKPDSDLSRTASGAAVVITTAHGSAHARLSDVDPWGRLRITGTGRPPF